MSPDEFLALLQAAIDAAEQSDSEETRNLQESLSQISDLDDLDSLLSSLVKMTSPDVIEHIGACVERIKKLDETANQIHLHKAMGHMMAVPEYLDDVHSKDKDEVTDWLDSFSDVFELFLDLDEPSLVERAWGQLVLHPHPYYMAMLSTVEMSVVCEDMDLSISLAGLKQRLQFYQRVCEFENESVQKSIFLMDMTEVDLWCGEAQENDIEVTEILRNIFHLLLTQVQKVLKTQQEHTGDGKRKSKRKRRGTTEATIDDRQSNDDEEIDDDDSESDSEYSSLGVDPGKGKTISQYQLLCMMEFLYNRSDKLTVVGRENLRLFADAWLGSEDFGVGKKPAVLGKFFRKVVREDARVVTENEGLVSELKERCDMNDVDTYEMMIMLYRNDQRLIGGEFILEDFEQKLLDGGQMSSFAFDAFEQVISFEPSILDEDHLIAIEKLLRRTTNFEEFEDCMKLVFLIADNRTELMAGRGLLYVESMSKFFADNQLTEYLIKSMCRRGTLNGSEASGALHILFKSPSEPNYQTKSARALLLSELQAVALVHPDEVRKYQPFVDQSIEDPTLHKQASELKSILDGSGGNMKSKMKPAGKKRSKACALF